MSWRLLPVVAFFLGIAVAAALAVHAGLGAVALTLQSIGWGRLAAVCALQVVSLGLCATSWWLVAGGLPLWACFVARWIRDGASNLVGFVPAVGEAIASRALGALSRVDQGRSAATTIVDVGVEALAQGLYTVIGLVLLLPYLDRAGTVRWSLIVAAALVPILLLYGVSRHAGALRLAERWGGRLAAALGLNAMRFAETVRATFARRDRALASFAVHLAAWFAGAVQIYVAAGALGHPLDLAASVALESLVYAARSAFFMVPWAAGVQEGGFVLVGAALGLEPSAAIALSLVLRARDVLVGAPGLLAWYAVEVKSKMRRLPDATPQDGI